MGDFNGDGKSDLVTADYGGNTVSVLLGNGNGTFQAKQSFGTGCSPSQLRWAISTATARATWSADYGDNTVSVLLGNGNGTFQAKQSFAAEYQP